MIVIKINTENAAFSDGGNCGESDDCHQPVKCWEVARILRAMADSLETSGFFTDNPRDFNGNDVGTVETTRPDKALDIQ